MKKVVLVAALLIFCFRAQAQSIPDTMTVMQNEWALLKSGGRFNALASNDATSCVLVAWRLADGKAIAHSHFDVATNVKDSINEIIQELKKVSDSKIIVTIAGEDSDIALLNTITTFLSQNSVVVEQVFKSRNLTLDIHGQMSFDSKYSDSLGPIPARWARVQQDFDELKKSYESFLKTRGYPPGRDELNRKLRRIDF